MSSHSRPICGICRKWSITQMLVKPASSAVRAISASASAVEAGWSGKPKRDTCRPKSSVTGSSFCRSATSRAVRNGGGTSSALPARCTPAKPSRAQCDFPAAVAPTSTTRQGSGRRREAETSGLLEAMTFGPLHRSNLVRMGATSTVMPERELIAAARGGDEHAFRHLVELHRRELHAHCYRMMGSLHDAEDALQDALLRAWRGLPRFQGRSSPGSWLYRIATNACLDAIARRPKRVLPVDYGPPTG